MAVAVGVYAALRLLSVALLAVFAEHRDASVWGELSSYDATWYLDIATGGYDTELARRPNGGPAPTNLAFFPLYPGLIAALDPIFPGGPRAAALAISWVAGLVAAAGIYAVGAQVRDRRTGILLAAGWAVVPHAIVQSMAYTEGLFTAFAAWSLHAVLSRRWLLAGGLCLVAGLVRPTAAALVAAVGLACLVAVVRRQDGWRPWVGGLLAPLGLVGYLAWVGQRLDRLDGYYYGQKHTWGTSMDGGRYTVGQSWRIVSSKQDLALYAVTAVLIAAVVLFGLAVAERQPWPLLVYAGVVLVTTLAGSGYYHSKARLILPAFTLLLPVATALAGARARNLAAALGGLALGSAWYGAYLCLFWRYSP
ncbi:hypothetical protein WEI85_27805 [Actinomycetes bacterium KLBMP 9797]